MIWTYRVFHDDDGYCVRVVHYEQDGTLLAYQQTPAVPTGRTAEELAQDIQWFQEAFDLPILTTAELDAELAAKPPRVRRKGKTKTLDQVVAELELEGSVDRSRQPLSHELAEPA
jgi:hypothetical protein